MKKNILFGSIFLALGVFLILVGTYFFVLGESDIAVGRMGEYKMGKAQVQPMNFFSKEEFADGLKKTLQHQPSLRRLKFKCPDGSRSFTVYPSAIGIIGIPDKNVICDDGFSLLSYGGAYVRELPQ